MIDLYYWTTTNPLKVTILLEEIGAAKEGLLDHKAQERRKTSTLAEVRISQKPFYLLLDRASLFTGKSQ